MGFGLLLALGAAAQDDAESEENLETTMCEMLAMYELVQYSDAIDEEKKSNYKMQGLALSLVYPQCNEPAPAPEPERRIPVSAVLENDEWYDLEAVGCQAIVTATGDLPFFAMVTGEGLAGLSVDVFFAGENQSVEMDRIVYDIADNALPARVAAKYGKVFPLGIYLFDITIDDQIFRLQWNREGKAYRYFVLECPDRQPDADASMVLEGEAEYLIADQCVLLLDQVGENFNTQASGDYVDEVVIDVILPGESVPASFDGALTDVLDSGYPTRRQWISGESFPAGRYEVMVTIQDQQYNFAWERSDPEYDSIHVVCNIDPS